MNSLIKKPGLVRARTTDGMMTFDSRTIDSAGAFLIGELERLDPMMHEPLVDIKWSRDIDLREDVSIADETSSFTNSQFASAGGINPNGKNWIGKDSNAIAAMALDIGKTAQPLLPWGTELSYTILELESAQKLGRPVDSQKLEGIRLKHQMDTDEMVYTGDTNLLLTGGVAPTGLFNAASVTNVTNVAENAASTSRLWTAKTPAEILLDVNEILTSVWAASGWAMVPTRLMLPPATYGYISTETVSTAGSVSILTYLENNSVTLRDAGRKLEVLPSKWLIGAGAGGTPGVTNGHDRMVAYTKAKDRVRFPLVPLQRTPLQYSGIFQKTTYFGRLGVLEVVYPETLGYRDGLS